MDEREQQPSGEEERDQQPAAEEESEIEVTDLDVEEEDAKSVKGGAALLENPSAGGEIRSR